MTGADRGEQFVHTTESEILADLQARPGDSQMAQFLSHANVVDPGARHLDGVTLAELTTLRLGGPCNDVVLADTQEVLVTTVAQADADGAELLLVAGGSNLVVADDGWPGRLVLVRTSGIEIHGDQVTVAAGESWDDFVASMVAQGRTGVEALSGIPGSVGATPIQNVGAYGQEVAQTIDAVLVWDRQQRVERWMSPTECQFSYRDSQFKRQPHRYVVLQVRFNLPLLHKSAPIRYAELAAALGVSIGQTESLVAVRDAVIALRRLKGMVLAEDDHDTWSAGSFFTNPVVPVDVVAGLPPQAPQFPVESGVATETDMVKLSAAWLIENAGFTKGYALSADARVAISTKHSLALTNRGGASTVALLELARVIRDGVAQRHGILLHPEPNLVACSLD